MRELLFNDNISTQDMIEWGEKYQITEEKEFTCILIQIEKINESQFDVMQLVNELFGIIQKKSLGVLMGIVRGKICLIQNVEYEGQLYQDLDEIKNTVKNHSSFPMTIRIGVGENLVGFKGIRRSFNQAEQAVKLTGVNNETYHVIFYKDLGVYCLLEPLKGTSQLIEYYDNTIGKLINEESNKALITTLKTYFEENESLKSTSEKLYIHVNTLKYRMKQIEDITALSFKDSEDKFSLFLGLKIYDLIH